MPIIYTPLRKVILDKNSTIMDRILLNKLTKSVAKFSGVSN